MGEGQLLRALSTFPQAVRLDAGGQAVSRIAQAACMEVSVMTMTVNVCAPQDLLAPAVSRVSRKART